MASGEEITPVPVESDSAELHFLSEEWVFWYLIPNRTGLASGGPDADWNSYLHPVHAFQTVEDFGRIINSLEHPGKLLKGCRYYVFRRAVRPLWEDPAAAGGQMVFIEVNKEPDRGEELESIWVSVVLALTAGEFPENDSILGVEYSSRPSSFRIALWVSAHSVDLSAIQADMARVTNAIAGVQTQLISAE
jgi:translation initiation factor 4E